MDNFILDNEQPESAVVQFLRTYGPEAEQLDIATSQFDLTAFSLLQGQWQQASRIRVLIGAGDSEASDFHSTKIYADIKAAIAGNARQRLDTDRYFPGVPGLGKAVRDGRVAVRLYRHRPFRARAFIVKGATIAHDAAIVGSSNFIADDIASPVQLNIRSPQEKVAELRAWFDRHWNEAEDIGPAIGDLVAPLETPTAPFLVYLKSLHALFQDFIAAPGEWENAGPDAGGSRLFPLLDKYQQDGYRALLAIAERYGGAFLCDGVGLGKTFVGMMLIERLTRHDRKKVVLLVPKSARQTVWEDMLAKYLPETSTEALGDLAIYNHTDLQSKARAAKMEKVLARADVVVIDEAHAFRNTGVRDKSRYWRLHKMLEGKKVFMMTATPVNNRLWDLKHMIDLFARKDDHFKQTLLIESLRRYFIDLDSALQSKVLHHLRTDLIEEEGLETDLAEAENVLQDNHLVRSLVVQRSRAFVRKDIELHGGRSVNFPISAKPQVIDYSLTETLGGLLVEFERAFERHNPLFNLAPYVPTAYLREPDDVDPWVAGRQRQVVSLIRIQFLKRLESSVHAFDRSCCSLLLRLFAFVSRNAAFGEETTAFQSWMSRNLKAFQYANRSKNDDDEDEDGSIANYLEKARKLDRTKYDLEKMVEETYADLDLLASFLHHLMKLSPDRDDKLASLKRKLQSDSVLSKQKVLIFTEFKDTARYLEEQLHAAGISGVDEIDGQSAGNRRDVIERFAPYYNGSSSAELVAQNKQEIRVLISTDVLSEGLNLQDATRLINYDLHWNPVRFMQRIGRVNRRMNDDIEKRLVADHPEVAAIRSTTAYWSFLPPDDLDRLLPLYEKLTGKILRISKTFGIEGGRLIKPEDEFEALRNFNEKLETMGQTALDGLQHEYESLAKAHPDLLQRALALPDGIASGRDHPVIGQRSVFACYRVPYRRLNGKGGRETTLDGAPAYWGLWNLNEAKQESLPEKIAPQIRCKPDTAFKRCLDAELQAIRRDLDSKAARAILGTVDAKRLGVHVVAMMALE